ncbi:hypothetical protein CNQ84_06845 [Pseudomonas abyssi]|uniref:O-antigen ligase-related domain-containing protein n=1 Tax=Pseudomonas abyssi TaxID=170540 RepID=A0A2A3MJ98_9PSED|nr:O-antigen ligase family protein [Pseudomonas abyssi]MAD01314.1 O-antigen ligase domain-containing protein [Pseudomonadales bacterium]PBK04861.1 hypothetical protein CNQ84_06845 [Pseudomonas abyssi]
MHIILAVVILGIALVPAALYVAMPTYMGILFLAHKTKTTNKSQGTAIPSSAIIIATIIIVTLFLSVLANQSISDLYLSFRGSARYMIYLAFAVTVAKTNPNTLRSTLRLLLIPLALGLALQNYLTLYEPISGTTRYKFIFEHPNHFAYFLVPIFFYYLALEKNQRYKLLGISIVSISLALSKSSGAALTVSAITIVYFSKNSKALLYGLLCAIALASLAYITGTYDKLYAQITSFSPGELNTKIDDQNFGGSGSLSWRLVYWGAILKSISIESWHSLLIGLGYGSMSYGSYAFDFMYTDPHNDIIKTLAENGLIGIVTLAYISYLAGRKLTKHKLAFFLSLLIPMFFGNILVNAAYISTTIITFHLLHRASTPDNEY